MNLVFKGEESDRFSRLALELLEVFPKNTIRVLLEGREPLTSKYISIEGTVANALNQGYRRHVEIHETDTNTVYWAAGTNATSSIATVEITFLLDDSQINTLVRTGSEKRWFIPTLSKRLNLDDDWCFVDEAPQVINLPNAKKLISLLKPECDSKLLRETVLVLRSYAEFLSHNIKLRLKCEMCLISLIDQVSTIDEYKDATIAIVELMGYVGSARSVPSLRKMIFTSEHIHIKWAAITALGRNPDDNVLDILLESTNLFQVKNGDSSVTLRADVPDREWIEAALLLCISRRIGSAESEKQRKMEEYFVRYFSSNNTVLHRYACFGLSQLASISIRTIDLIIERLESTEVITERGYYTMALLPTFRANSSETSSRSDIWTNERINRVRHILSSISFSIDLENEPDEIWGLENLADLSLEIEDNSLATSMHNYLSNLFFDWRYSYYRALSLYEKAEKAIKDHREYIVVYRLLREALSSIESVDDIDEYASSIIDFRRTIISARISLIEILHEWMSSTDSVALERLRGKLREQVLNRYKQFTIDESIEGVSKRELDCLADSVTLLGIIDEILTLDILLVSNASITDKVKNYIVEVFLNVDRLVKMRTFSKVHSDVLCRLYDLINAIKVELEGSMTFEQVLRIVHDIIEYINDISWTMPAQMCLLNGLGSGTIATVHKSKNEDGTLDNPYIVRAANSNSISVDLSVQLTVSSGAAIQTCVVCDTNNEPKTLYGVVEGSAICTFELSKTIFPMNRVVPISFHLEFSTNDVVQKSKPFIFYYKRKSE